MTIDVKPCVYDPNFRCHIGCETLKDKPMWCTYRLDLYEKALELEKEIDGEEKTIEYRVDPFNSNFSVFISLIPQSNVSRSESNVEFLPPSPYP